MIQDTKKSRTGQTRWKPFGKSQQSLAAAAMVMMLRAAYDATQDARFLRLQRAAVDWFLGANDLCVPLYDFHTEGCADGLMAGDVNGNQDAESTVSFLLGLLSVLEGRNIPDRIHAPERSLPSAPFLDAITTESAGPDEIP